MAILVDKQGNSFIIPSLVIQEPESSDQIFDNLKNLAKTLGKLTGINRSNLGSVQSTIQNSNPAFNVFAVASNLQNSESLVGLTSSNGKRTFTKENFVYNISLSNRLSTGKQIVDMSGGVNSSLSEIDGKKWMGNAVFDNTYGFMGIMLWIFTNELITSTNSVVSSTLSVVTTAASIFNPNLFTTTSNYRRIHQVVIDKNGSVLTYSVSGNAGWLYSTAQSTSVNGYNATSRFSADDGLWAYVINDKVNGDTPGPGYQKLKGFGFGNYNNADSSSNLYWGVYITSSNYVGFIFTGDA